jgi:hypothetical protein
MSLKVVFTWQFQGRNMASNTMLSGIDFECESVQDVQLAVKTSLIFFL